jgi:hypothetical protein
MIAPVRLQSELSVDEVAMEGGEILAMRDRHIELELLQQRIDVLADEKEDLAVQQPKFFAEQRRRADSGSAELPVRCFCHFLLNAFNKFVSDCFDSSWGFVCALPVVI